MNRARREEAKVTTLRPAPFDDCSEDKLLASAYSDLEPEVTDLTRMARLADLQLYKAVGGLSCKDKKYIAIPDYEATDLAIFAVSEMAKMAKRFEDLYYRAFETKP
jgi:hypothetical protein